VTYDVNTESEAGKGRLRKVAKICERYGQRVQNSVFECILDMTQYTEFKAELLGVIKEKIHSIRFYRLGNNYKSQVETFGTNVTWAQDDILVL
jgi:CRISPR-associated protein Cas2